MLIQRKFCMHVKDVIITEESQAQMVNTLWYYLYKLLEMTNTELWNI